jgi:hypothetical protein
MHIIEALGLVAFGAHKVYVIIVVVAKFAARFANGVSCSAIGAGYGMDDALFTKSLKGAVNSNPIHILEAAFNIAVPNGACVLLHKELQYLPAGFGNAQLVFTQYGNCRVFHNHSFQLNQTLTENQIYNRNAAIGADCQKCY